MVSTQMKYSDETLISPHTNKPVSKLVKTEPIIFWCKLCCKKLVTPVSAVRHMSAKGHVDRLYSQVNETSIVQQPVLKTQEPVNKKTRTVVEKSIFKCDDCKLEFDNERTALFHFKGKKHTKVFAAKITAKLNSSVTKKGGKQSSSGGRGGNRGGKSRGGWIGSKSTGGIGKSGGGQLQNSTTWQKRGSEREENNQFVSQYYGLGNTSLDRNDISSNNINNVPRTNWYDSYSNNSQKYDDSGNSGNNVPRTNVYENDNYYNKSQNNDDTGNYSNNVPSTSSYGNDWYNNKSQNYDGGNSDNNLPRTNVHGSDPYSNNFQNYDGSGNYGNNVPRTNLYGNDYYSNSSQNFSDADSFQNVNFNSSRRSQGNCNFAGELQNSLSSEIFRLKRRLNEI